MQELTESQLAEIQAALPYTLVTFCQELQPSKPCFTAGMELSGILRIRQNPHVIRC